MSVYTRRLAGPVEVPPTGSLLLYTVPVGKVAVIRNIHSVNTSGTNVWTVLGIGSVANAVRIYRQPVPIGESVIRETRVAMVAGEQLFGVGAGGNHPVTITGYELDA